MQKIFAIRVISSSDHSRLISRKIIVSSSLRTLVSWWLILSCTWKNWFKCNDVLVSSVCCGMRAVALFAAEDGSGEMLRHLERVAADGSRRAVAW